MNSPPILVFILVVGLVDVHWGLTDLDLTHGHVLGRRFERCLTVAAAFAARRMSWSTWEPKGGLGPLLFWSGGGGSGLLLFWVGVRAGTVFVFFYQPGSGLKPG